MLLNKLKFLVDYHTPFYSKFGFLYGTDDESTMDANRPVQGSFLSLLPSQPEVPEKSESQ